MRDTQISEIWMETKLKLGCWILPNLKIGYWISDPPFQGPMRRECIHGNTELQNYFLTYNYNTRSPVGCSTEKSSLIFVVLTPCSRCKISWLNCRLWRVGKRARRWRHIWILAPIDSARSQSRRKSELVLQFVRAEGEADSPWPRGKCPIPHPTPSNCRNFWDLDVEMRPARFWSITNRR